MSLPAGAVTMVVITFIFSPLALLALTWRLWSRRIMKLKLCLNDYTAILATVNFLMLFIKGNSSPVRLIHNRSLWLGQTQSSSLVSRWPRLNLIDSIPTTLDSGLRGGLRNSPEGRSSKRASNSSEGKTFSMPLGRSFSALTAVAICTSATSVGSCEHLRQTIHC